MKFIAVKVMFITLGLAGCGSMVDAHSSCSQSNPSYEATWNCIKGRISAGSAGMTNNSQAIRYVAAGDALLEQVRSGRMSDTQAKAVLAAELEQAETSFNRARSITSPTVCNRLGNSLICY
jgi:uncharacterized protein YceK